MTLRLYIDKVTNASAWSTLAATACTNRGFTNLIGANIYFLQTTKTSLQTLTLSQASTSRPSNNTTILAALVGPRIRAQNFVGSASPDTFVYANSCSGSPANANVLSIAYCSVIQANGTSLRATDPFGGSGIGSVASSGAFQVSGFWNNYTFNDNERLLWLIGVANFNAGSVTTSWGATFVTNSATNDLDAGGTNAFIQTENNIAPATDFTASVLSTRSLTPAGSASLATGKAFSYASVASHKSADFNPTKPGLESEALGLSRVNRDAPTFDVMGPSAAGLSFANTTSTPPTIGAFTPAAGAVSPTQSISVTITDDDGIGSATLSVDFPALDRSEIAYRSGAFLEAYLASTVTPVVVDEHTVSLAFSVVRSPGWPSAFTVNVEAVDELGASSESSSAYTLSTTEFPTLANVSPASGSSLYADSIISFDVLDATSLLRVYIKAKYADGAEEVIWFGTAFSGQFGDSTQTAIAGGYHFAVQRVGGWEKAPQIYVDAIDSEGNIP